LFCVWHYTSGGWLLYVLNALFFAFFALSISNLWSRFSRRQFSTVVKPQDVGERLMVGEIQVLVRGPGFRSLEYRCRKHGTTLAGARSGSFRVCNYPSCDTKFPIFTAEAKIVALTESKFNRRWVK